MSMINNRVTMLNNRTQPMQTPPDILMVSFFRGGLVLILLTASVVMGQFPRRPGTNSGDSSPWFPGPPAGPPPFGFGAPEQEKVQLVKRFDTNGDGWLNAEERQTARVFLKEQGTRPRPGTGPRRQFRSAPEPGPRINPADVPACPDAPLYAANVLRTFFLKFEEADWENELEEFHGTDVDVPADLTVDGTAYPGVGVRFRGASSYSMVETGFKRSFNISLDLVHPEQKLQGHSTLNLLNSHEDPSFLRAVLFLYVASKYIPAPQANLVRVVINGECWGVYVNVEQFDKQFISEWFDTRHGSRWKVPGSPHGRGSLAYLGENADAYRGIYEIKSKDDPDAWDGLVGLCRVLAQVSAENEDALAHRLDIDGALKFLALENVFINNDGYWIRTSDYSLYRDTTGCFHVIPADVNETFSTLQGGPGGPGGLGGPGPQSSLFPPPPPPSAFSGRFENPGRTGTRSGSRQSGVALDPLIGADRADRPLISRLLAVPGLRTRYLQYVREIAATWLDWDRLGPVAAQYHTLISDAVIADTRKLYSSAAFSQSLDGKGQVGHQPGPERQVISLKSFADQRRVFLLNHPPVRGTEARTEAVP